MLIRVAARNLPKKQAIGYRPRRTSGNIPKNQQSGINKAEPSGASTTINNRVSMKQYFSESPLLQLTRRRITARKIRKDQTIGANPTRGGWVLLPPWPGPGCRGPWTGPRTQASHRNPRGRLAGGGGFYYHFGPGQTGRGQVSSIGYQPRRHQKISSDIN